jgi:hypothetical protein
LFKPQAVEYDNNHLPNVPGSGVGWRLMYGII